MPRRRDDRAANRLPRRTPPVLMRATSTTFPPPEEHLTNLVPDNRTGCADHRRRQGPPAAPRSGSARAWTPPPYRHAHHQVGDKETGQPRHLTGPAPSGMTCGNARSETVLTVNPRRYSDYSRTSSRMIAGKSGPAPACDGRGGVGAMACSCGAVGQRVELTVMASMRSMRRQPEGYPVRGMQFLRRLTSLASVPAATPPGRPRLPQEPDAGLRTQSPTGDPPWPEQ
jgi:hypothetical protein